MDSFCSCCLSRDRKLERLFDNIQLYYQLLFGNYEVEKDVKYFDLVICFECKAVLNKIAKFQKQVRTVHYMLQDSVDNKNMVALSRLSLSPIKNEDCDINMKFDDDKMDYDIPNLEAVAVPLVNDIKLDIDKIEDLTNDYFAVKAENNDEDSDYLLDNSDHLDNNYNLDGNTKKSGYKRKYTHLNLTKVMNRHLKMIKLNNSNAIDEIYVLVKVGKQDKDMYNKACKNYIDTIYKCNMCEYENVDKLSVDEHVLLHKSGSDAKRKSNSLYSTLYSSYKCTQCLTFANTTEKIQEHFKKLHSHIYICKTCNVSFGMRKAFSKHCKSLHALWYCDFCGKRFKQRRLIIKHLLRYHTPNKCNICKTDYDYRSWIYLQRHFLAVHPENVPEYLKRKAGKRQPALKIENHYCVECDKQFKSRKSFRAHLSGTAHRPKVKNIPCPECGKMFARKTYMNNHYTLFHAKKTKHYCEICDKYFSTNFGRRQHKELVHDKKQLPKDKICDICGRGFALRRTLVNHIRTHTGERPFACSLCPARFAQSTARDTHEKAVHNKLKRPPKVS